MAEQTSMQPLAINTEANDGRRENLRRAIYRFRANPLAMIGLITLLIIVVIAITAPYIVPFPEDATGKVRATARLRPPDETYLFGTDNVGRDIFSRTLIGTGLALTVGVVIIALATTIGVTVGATAAYFGGWVDELLMRLTDIFMAFPRLILALARVAVLGPGIFNAVLAIALTAWPPYARVARAETLTVRNSDYIAAVRLQGASHLRIITGHIVPMCLPSVIIRVTLDMAGVILIAAGLGFLGLGVQPPLPEWGQMISAGRKFLFEQWWIPTMPGLAIFLVSLGFNLLGDGLRDVLDPRSATK